MIQPRPQYSASQLLKEALLTAGGVFLASASSHNIHFTDFASLAFAAVLLSIIHTFIKPLLLLISLPLIVLSMGLGIWLINAGLLLLVSQLIPGFHVASLSSALWGSLVISLFCWLWKVWFGPKPGPRSRVQVRYHTQTKASSTGQQHRPQQRRQSLNDDDVIDI
jgi:putative membrane protein